MKLFVLTCAVTALLLHCGVVLAEEKPDTMMEQTTESPIAKTTSVGDSMKADAVAAGVALKPEMKKKTESIKKLPVDSKQHTIADFVIHPLIAMKPRTTEAESGKQADTSSNTSSPWQLFGLNGGLGPVSSLAGWLGNRMQLAGLVDTPVRESSTTSTTTIKPDIIVKLNQRVSTKKPVVSIDRPLRKTKRPYRFNSNNFEDSYYSDEYEDDDNYEQDFSRKRINRRRYQEDEEKDYEEYVTYEQDDEASEAENEEADDNNDDIEEEAEEEDEPPRKQQNNNRERQTKPVNSNKRKTQRRRINNSQRKQQQLQQEYSADEYDDDYEDPVFYYNKNQDSKRSKTEPTLIQRGQQSLLKQLKHFTLGQTPAEIGNALRKSQKSMNKKRLQQATLLINRNGQTIYLAPELLQMSDATNSEVNASLKKQLMTQYPQPPLTVPYRRKGQPTQYITIPWSKLGISPPNQIASLTEGLQSQPLILNIPQSAIDGMQNKKKQSITADAVPLIAEASAMKIFEPPQMSNAAAKPNKKSSAGATKTKLAPTRLRTSAAIEKAPADDSTDDKENSAEAMEDNSKPTQFLVIGDEFGDTKISRNAYRQILDYFNQHRVGRQQIDGGRIPIINYQNEKHLTADKEKPPKATADVSDNLGMTAESPMMVVILKKDTEDEALV